MREDIKDEWIKELRSDKYKQGRNYLRQRVKGETLYCCLGVLCEIYARHNPNNLEWRVSQADSTGGVYRFGGHHAILPNDVKDWAGIRTGAGRYIDSTSDTYNRRAILAEDNDNGASFEEIANTIERYWRAI